MITVKRILVPIDFSRESELALDWAVTLLSGTPNAIIHMLHVVEPVELSNPIYPFGWESDTVVRSEEEDRTKLETWRKKVPADLKTVATSTVGDPLDEVQRVCEEQGIDLVVMTTHGRRGLARMVHPSLSERIVRIAPCPVLVLHNNARTLERVKEAV
jgi:nucleotide-binding universal stress UspA family protein